MIILRLIHQLNHVKLIRFKFFIIKKLFSCGPLLCQKSIKEYRYKLKKKNKNHNYNYYTQFNFIIFFTFNYFKYNNHISN